MTKELDKELEINLEEVEDAPVAKKAKKEKKAKVAAVPDGHITPNQLAEEFGMNGRDLRVLLRGMYPDHNKGERWSWAPDSEQLASIKAAIKAKKEAAVERKAAPKKEKAKKTAKADVVESEDDSLEIVIE